MLIPTLIGLAVAIVVLGGWAVGSYNKLVGLRNRAEEMWAQIDVQLTRRHDLIPNLVATVKGYAEHESGVFEAVTKARAAAVSAGSVGEQGKAEGMLQSTLRSLFAVAEAYPDLKANTNFLELQNELAATEDQVGRARTGYNGAVRAYDTQREVFPANVVAGMFNFAAREYFELADPDAAGAPKVEF